MVPISGILMHCIKSEFGSKNFNESTCGEHYVLKNRLPHGAEMASARLPHDFRTDSARAPSALNYKGKLTSARCGRFCGIGLHGNSPHNILPRQGGEVLRNPERCGKCIPFFRRDFYCQNDLD